jgi:hypothetical protein
VAFEKLDEVRHAGLLATQRFSEYYDRVGDAVREYCGHRYGFDGLECTTDEMLTELRRSALVGVTVEDVSIFLQQCDLVKFARMTPSEDDCQKALGDAELIVRKTMVAVDGSAAGGTLRTPNDGSAVGGTSRTPNDGSAAGGTDLKEEEPPK